MTQVVAALIWDKDKFLICQRPANKARALLWEFVGGKVERGETPEEALMRECREEIGVSVTVRDRFAECEYEYDDIVIRLTVFNATISEGCPERLEHADMRWITPSQIGDFKFCPADAEILERIMRRSAAQGQAK